MLFMSVVLIAFSLALANAGNNIAARMAMIAMTTRSSMSVNASLDGCCFSIILHFNLTYTIEGRRTCCQAGDASKSHQFLAMLRHSQDVEQPARADCVRQSEVAI